jgi:hypothetical protein
LKIHKCKLIENENKLLQTNWKFNIDRIYEENIDIGEIYENEIVCSDYFSELHSSNYPFKGTFIFVSKDTGNII